MRKGKPVVLSKEELVKEISALYQTHKDATKYRVVISDALNKQGIGTVTGKEWNSNRLNQFIRNNMPDLTRNETQQAAADNKELAVQIVPKATEPVVGLVETLKEQGPKKETKIPDAVSAKQLEAARTALQEQVGSVKSDMESHIGSVKSEMESQIGGVKSDIESEVCATKSEMENQVRSIQSDVQSQVASIRSDIEAMVQEQVKSVMEEVPKKVNAELSTAKDDLGRDMDALRGEVKTIVEQEVQTAMDSYSRDLGFPKDIVEGRATKRELWRWLIAAVVAWKEARAR
ncbi:hypothetical protein ACFL2Q_17665 [Thermodesulfobacteriota bacterium]